MSVLFDWSSKIIAIHLTFAKELGLPIRPTDIGAKKINSTTLNSFRAVVAAFLVTDKANQVRSFEKIFLIANVSLEIVFEMLFLTFSGTDINFLGWKLRWRTYTTNKAFSTTKCVELVGKKEFAAAVFDSKYETFIVHVASFSSTPLDADIHPFCSP